MLPENHDMIFVSLEDWDDIWRRNQFICAALARRYPSMRILFVGIARNTLRLLVRGRIVPLLMDPIHTVTNYPNIFSTQPLRLALERFDCGLRYNQSLYRKHILTKMHELQLRNPILWINANMQSHLVDTQGFPPPVPHSALIYDITDDWITLTQSELDRQRNITTDRSLCERADAVIVCSEKLHELKRSIVPPEKLSLIPNGVDADHYAGTAAEGGEPSVRPAELQSLPRPILGYTGTIHPDRIDVPFLLAMAQKMTVGCIVLIGPSYLSHTQTEALKATGRIHLIPAVPYQKIPTYMRMFDITITPHVVSHFTESLNPIKLWEYLALGKPIISTPVAGFRDFPKFVYLARTPEDFLNAVEIARHESPGRIALRQTEARKHSWDSRVDQVEKVIVDALAAHGEIHAR